jgi:hypothetical protein
MFLAVSMHVQELLGCGLAGLAGAAAVGAASILILRAPLSGARVIRAAAWGAATGMIFGINGTFHIPDFSQAVMLTAGFVAWQTAVGFSLYRTEIRVPA